MESKLTKFASVPVSGKTTASVVNALRIWMTVFVGQTCKDAFRFISFQGQRNLFNLTDAWYWSSDSYNTYTFDLNWAITQ